MKISEFIAKLQEAQSTYGDVEIYMQTACDDTEIIEKVVTEETLELDMDTSTGFPTSGCLRVYNNV